MCGSMVDIQRAATESRRGKKENRRKKPQDENTLCLKKRPTFDLL